MKTSCNGHRTLGYSYSNGKLVCRKCGKLDSAHETHDETAARLYRKIGA